MGQDKMMPGYRPVKDAHKTLGLWPIHGALTFAFTAAIVSLIAAWLLLSWFLGSPPHAKPKPLETKDLLELLKLVFALVAGVGALVALVTAYRRQRVDEAAGERAERVQAHVEYGQAVELLGHDKAAVRLGGLYSLERLAQDHPYYRQTVTDVVCSYLRMPFQVPTAHDEAQQEQSGDAHPDPTITNSARQELQVRLTAQRLLKRHLTKTSTDQPPRPTYWDNIHIDLAGAQLIDFDFSQCHPTDANFANTHFTGHAIFREARFSGDTGFGRARFSGGAWFDGARFNRNSRFGDAQFSGIAWFARAEFSGDARFDGTRFSGEVWLEGARFNEGVWFDGARFNGSAWFDGARFNGSAWFDGARFNGDVWFGQAQFEREVSFAGATASYPNDKHVWPSPWRTQAVTPDTAELIRES
ncbi:pentapeptide repeat-containing protein [Actinomadura geliboluensis]|uniref:pentapeptide repeat-containing protein n=1 Tax=Actinomadura geliboluensis TaxID=882440 RepID=UPI00371AF4B9